MSDTLKAKPSPLQMRDELETMVLTELLGPGSAEEEVIEPPGTRYFVGVLAPRKKPKAGAATANAAVVPPPSDDPWQEKARERALSREELSTLFAAMKNAKGFSRENELTLSGVSGAPCSSA